MLRASVFSRKGWGVLAGLAAAWPTAAWAQAESPFNGADTAWMLTATALVLFMTIPGLALFYGGLVRTKNVLSVLMQCFVITCMVTVLWFLFGFSMTFSPTGMVKGATNWHAFVGALDNLFCHQIKPDSTYGTLTIPQSVFFCYQLTFAIITPALIVGAFAERMKFSAMLVFMALWSVIVYNPIAHMIWGGEGAFLADRGTLDFAGGIVVHLSAGIAALVCALVIGKRHGYPTALMPPHNLTLAVTGAGMLWVGWFGFNAGSALAANGTAGMAMFVTQISAGTAAMAWMFVEWIKHGKPSVLGIITGAVAGLATITPASGFVGPGAAFFIGIVSGVACFFCATSLKRLLGYDDSLDAFGVHGVGGLIGSLLTGIFAAESLGGVKAGLSISSQLGSQLLAIAITIVWSGVVSYILLKLIDRFIGLRVTSAGETKGLDLTDHDERGYNL